MPSPMTKAGVPRTPRPLAKMAFRSIARIQGGVLHVAREALGIEADGVGDGEDVIEVEGAVRPQQLPVNCLVVALRPCRQRRTHCQRRFRPEDRELLENQT